ncbi:IS110 family transposase [Culicoidibacter larvae]|uniref:IS110 family transposase n=1 Tax=Culicoidibacter larvae TaxID=2579976 RepID=A0A5R8Q8S6_9FIRM|nr:IS110 family transposase [Culicoidibacter larvae]TLG70258.1 IS110 family transposase [Culicoidibacter larvae]
MNHSIFVGIDVAKHYHDAHIFNQNTGEVIHPHFHFVNDSTGFEALLHLVSTFNKDEVLFGVESTGRYHIQLVKYLHHKGYSIGILNPLQTNRLREVELRQTKTDKIDARIIVQALLLNYHQEYTETNYDDLKYLSRARHSWVKERSKLKVDVINCLDTLFPEYAAYFKGAGVHSKTSYNILKKYPSAHYISQARIDGLSNKFVRVLKHATPEGLKELAQSSIGRHSKAIAYQLIATIDRIDFISKQICELDKQIDVHLQLLDSPILSIPGISNVLAAAILGEIGNIKRFSNASKIIAFAGLNPKVHQSGNFIAANMPISKRGSRLLRYALIKAASIIWLHDPTFKAYYLRKKATGKHHNVVLGHVAHKLVFVIYRLIDNGIMFEKGYN